MVDESSVKAFVLPPGHGRTIDLGNFEMSLKAGAISTGGLFTLLEAAEPPNFGPPLHIHHDCAEAFFVLDGMYRIFVGNDVYECPAGSFVFIPAGVEHGFRVGDVPSRKVNIYSPSAMEGYFDELASAIANGSGDPERLSEIAGEHGMEVTGPVPEGYL